MNSLDKLVHMANQIALNLKDPQGQEVLRRLIKDLDVDVFCCHTVPKRYKR